MPVTASATTDPSAHGENCRTVDQNWPGGVKQGQAELLAIKAAVGTLDASVNVGFMMFTDNATGREGGYIRYAMRPMTPVNRTALQDLLQKVYDNFSAPTEKSAGSIPME